MMNSSIPLTTKPSSPHPTTLFSHLLPHNPLRLSTTVNFHHSRRRRYRISSIRASSSIPTSTSSDQPDKTIKPDVFGPKKELTGIQSLVDGMSPPVRIASSVVIFAGAIAAGYGLGSKFGGSRNVALGGAAALGAAGAGVAYALNSCVPEVAAVNLHNYVADFDDPGALKKEDIEAIANKYGVSKQNEAFNAELCDIYCRFVSSVLPPGSEDLKGDEVETIIKFKSALGIDDPDAAAMHMEIGRRIFRQRLETGDRDANQEQRRAFQKLIYVSTLVFGEASSFLLPWKRVFKVTDAQVEVAVRENAQRLYALKLKLVGQDVNVDQLVALREAQLMYRLSDELAEDMFKELTRKVAEENISTALSVLKSRTRAEATRIVEELNKVLEFNDLLISLRNHPEASRFARGVGPISFMGGEYQSDRKIDELKLLYRVYVWDSLSSGRVEDSKLVALNQLRNIFGLGRREAESIVLEVTTKKYRERLAQAVSSGDLAAADSKAAYLQSLCEELNFDAEKAVEIHEEIYRQKLQQAAAIGELSDQDVKMLEKLQIMFCIPKETVEGAHADICGALFEKVVKEAIAAGVDGYDAEIKKSVRKAAYGLRLTREVAMNIASKAVRKIFISYIQRARAAGSRTESARELKKMIAFNSLVVTELVADIKGESSDTPPEEPVKEDEKPTDEDEDEDEEWESLQSLRKVKPGKETLEKKIQTEINLKDDLPERDRSDLYKTYLLYCITGEVRSIPLGTQFTTKKDDSEYALLNQLGSILGLTPKEIVEVHRSLAEQAFRQKAEVILADGQLTKARIEQLNELQKDVGLPSEYAQKIIKAITTTKMSAALESAVNEGRLSVKEIRELREAGVEVDTMITDSLRERLFRRTVENIFSSGTGEFNEEEVYEKIPKDLNINVGKAKQLVHDRVQSRLSNSLIDAVSSLRQRNNTGVVSSLNDLLACDKAVPTTPLSWEKTEELADLFVVYLKSDPASEKLSRLQYLLNISDSTAEALKAMKDRALPNGNAGEEEFVF